jgi:lysozyme
MKTSPAAIDKLKEHEGKKIDANTGKHVVYADSAGKLTIGYGHLLTSKEISSNIYKDGISEEEATSLLAKDLVMAEMCIEKTVKAALNQNQFDALVDFIFNLGAYNFKSSTLLNRLNEKKYDEVPKEMKRWNKAYNPKTKQKEPLKGLTSRREFEANQFASPVSITLGPIGPSTLDPDPVPDVITRQDTDTRHAGESGRSNNDDSSDRRDSGDPRNSGGSSSGDSQPSGETMDINNQTYDTDPDTSTVRGDRDDDSDREN